MDSAEGVENRQKLVKSLHAYREKAKSVGASDSQLQQLNTALDSAAKAAENKNSGQLSGPRKTFANLAGKPPFNGDDELLNLSDEILDLLQKHAGR